MITSADNILFRASSAGHLMVSPRSKAELLSETTKRHLVDVYVSRVYDRKTDIQSMAMEKGIACEEDSLSLYYDVTKRFGIIKNQNHFSNEYIQGTPDLILKDLIVDIKSSWDIFTFFRARTQDIEPIYYWQMQCYMALTGATKAIVAYCLVDTPADLVERKKRNLFYSGITETSPLYEDACIEIDRLSNYSDIPKRDRVFEFHVERSEDDIERLYSRIKDCRNWMNENLFRNN